MGNEHNFLLIFVVAMSISYVTSSAFASCFASYFDWDINDYCEKFPSTRLIKIDQLVRALLF